MKAKTKTPKTPKTPFRKLTAAQKRVAIAKDVLKQIVARRVTVKRGSFVTSQLDKPGAENYNQASVLKLKTCTACAVGCAILSGIRLFNQVDSALINLPNEMYRWFKPAQVRMVEQAFELGCGWFRGDYSHAAVAFGHRYPDATKRAIAIFKNIIAHKGRFVP